MRVRRDRDRPPLCLGRDRELLRSAAAGGVLGRCALYQVTQRNTDEFKVADPTRQGGALYFIRVPESKVVKNRLHLDLVTEGAMELEVERLTALGARSIEVRHDPDSLENPDTWTVMQDPEGNEFCVTSWTTLTGWS